MIPNRKTLERLLWKHTHKDYRGTLGESRTVLHSCQGQGTCLITIAALTDAQILGKLPARIREALTSDRFNDGERKQALRGLCIYQTGSGLPWTTYCTAKPRDGFYCAEHARDIGES